MKGGPITKIALGTPIINFLPINQFGPKEKNNLLHEKMLSIHLARMGLITQVNLLGFLNPQVRK